METFAVTVEIRLTVKAESREHAILVAHDKANRLRALSVRVVDVTKVDASAITED